MFDLQSSALPTELSKGECEVVFASKACDPPFSLQLRYERRKSLLTQWSCKPLPGGLVARIRRSHRRGPGSIPGQGSMFLDLF